MKFKVSIRKAESRDIERMVDFNIRMADETEHKNLDTKIVRKGVSAVINDPSKGFYLVAEDECSSRVIGQLLVTFEWSDWRDKCFWWIQSVYVDQEFRRKKIFSQLFKALGKLADSRENDVCGFRLYVDERNESAKKAYESLGFKKTAYQMYEKDL